MHERFSPVPIPPHEPITPFQKRMRFQAKLIGAYLAKHQLDEASALQWVEDHSDRFAELYTEHQHTLAERPWEDDQVVEAWLTMMEHDTRH